MNFKAIAGCFFVATLNLVWMPVRAQSTLLLNISDSANQIACSVANFQSLGVAGLTGSEAISQCTPTYNATVSSPLTFKNGGQVLYLSSPAVAYAKNAGSGGAATGGLLDLYLENTSSSAITLSVSNLNLTAGTNYTLYLIGTVPVSDTNEDGLFTPLNNNTNITFASTVSGHGVLVVSFTTSATCANTDTLNFTWARFASSGDGVFSGLAIVPGAATQTQTLTITNGVSKYGALTNTVVNLTGKCELWVTNTLLPLTDCTINLNSTNAWLFLPGVKPSMVVASTCLHQVRVNGTAAAADVNVRVAQYGQNGTVVIPHAPSFQPLTVFTGTEFTGTAASYSQWNYYTGTACTNLSSFKLKRGYQAVLARDIYGANYSQCYVAQDGDLEIGVLPATLDKQVQFIYVTPWRWTGKKGIAGNPPYSLLNVNWWYDWNIDSSSSRDLEYAAIHQLRYWPGMNQNWQSLGINTVLGYNEPDNTAQANIAVGDAFWSWPDLLGTGLRVGSPACTDGGVSSWLLPFMTDIAASQANEDNAPGLRVDFVAQHYYQAADPSNPSACASQMYNFLLNIWNNTHLPIWITEWNNGANWTDGSPYAAPTYAQQQADIQAMVNMLESTPFVERYTLYNWVEDTRSLVTSSNTVTPAGVTYSNLVSGIGYSQAMPDNGTRGLAEFLFATNTWDSSGYFNNGVAIGAPNYSTGHISQAQSIVLDGANSYVQLPANIAEGSAFTFAAWVYWNGGNNWQRIFDFGAVSTIQNGTPSQYMFLTPSSGSTPSTLRFAINSGSGEQIVERSGALASGSWQHVAVTLNGSAAILYLNGAPVATNSSLTILPPAFSPVKNYLGKSQFPDPLFSGKLDEVEIADYALTPAQISALYSSAQYPPFTGGTWTNNANGNWGAPNNWNAGLVANGVGTMADFSAVNITANRTVTLDSARTNGGLRFGDTSGAQTWTLAGAYALTLDGGATNLATIAVSQNTATVSANLAGTNGFAKLGNGTLVLSGTNVLGGGLYVDAGTVTIAGGSNSFGGSVSYVGYRTGTGTLTLTGGGLTAGGEFRVGGSDLNGAAYVATGAVTLASATLCVGSLTVARGNYTNNTQSGTVTLNSGSTLISTNDVTIEYAGAGYGKLALNGGTFIIGPAATKWLMVGYYDTGAGELDVTNGSLCLYNNTSLKMCRSGNTGTNLVNQVGGSVTFYSDAGVTVGGSGNLDLNYAGGTNSCNIYNLKGGTLTVPQIIASSTNAMRIFNFNGGTLKAAAATSSFMNLGGGNAVANVRNGGAVINDGGFSITLPQALTHSTLSGDNATDGGLTKLGAGTLTLSGTNTQTGATTISAGTLAVGATGSIARSAGVVVAAGAVLDVSAVSGGFTLGASQTLSGSGAVNGTVTCAGTISPGTSGGAIGTLTFSNAPVLKGVTAMSVNRASGVLANAQVSVPAGTLAFGGTLTVTSTGDALQTGDSFRLFNAASYAGAFAVTNLPALSSGLGWSNSLAANGSLTVVTTVSLVPTNLVWGVSAAGLTLSWPPDHTGWRLQAQTNPLDGGLNTNWADVSGGSLTNNVTFPMDPATGSVFYRLVYP